MAGLEPAVFGSELQRLMHWATRPYALRRVFTSKLSLFDVKHFSKKN